DVELFDFRLWLEPEVDLRVIVGADARQLVASASPKSLFDRGFPAKSLKHANRSLRFDDSLRDLRNLFLVRSPRGGGERAARRCVRPPLAIGFCVTVGLRIGDERAIRRSAVAPGRRSLGIGAGFGPLRHTLKLSRT